LETGNKKLDELLAQVRTFDPALGEELFHQIVRCDLVKGSSTVPENLKKSKQTSRNLGLNISPINTYNQILEEEGPMGKGNHDTGNLDRIALQVSKPQNEWVAEKAKALGISKQELIRRILDEYRGVTPSGWKS